MVVLADPAMDIALIAALFGLFSFAVNRKLINQKAMKESQKQMGEKRKKMLELMKKNDEKSKKESDKLNQEMMEQTSSIMKGSLKAMGVVLIGFLPVYWVVDSSYNAQQIMLPFNVPFIGSQSSWLLWWIVVGIITSIILQLGVKAIELSKGKKNA